MRRSLLAALSAAVLLPAVGSAQPIYPNPRLAALSPCGAKAGTTVEVILTGTDLEEIERLVFSHPGIQGTEIPPPEPDPKEKNPPTPPIKFSVTVAGDVPVGIHDVRVVGKWGISNPRAFAVGTLKEVAETEQNSDVPQANPIELGTTVTGDITNQTDVDFFKLAANKGQRVIVQCQAGEIDSRLTPDLRVYTADGRPVAQSRLYSDADAVAEFTPPADGEYLIRVAQQAYQYGGNEYFYRLHVSANPWVDAVFPPVVESGKTNAVTLYGRNLPGGQRADGETIDGRPLQQVRVTVTPPGGAESLAFENPLPPRAGGLDGFEFRLGPASNPVLLTYASEPIIIENGSNVTPESAQAITLPCELCGRLTDVQERDWYGFTAKQGEVFHFEGYSDRLGSPMDLYFMIRRKDNGQVLGYYDNHPSIPARAGTFFTYTDDPGVTFTAPADGEYEMMVATRSADPSATPRLVYRIVARQPKPDFRLVLAANADPSSAGATIRQGSSQNFQVVCYRRDGFDGEVTLSIEGLPAGVTCPPQAVGPFKSEGQLVIAASADAPSALAEVKIKGTATINGTPVTREARYGCQVWPTNQQGNIPAVSRLCRSLLLAVREKGPCGLETLTPEVTAAKGQNGVEIKYKLNGYHPEFKTNMQLRALNTAERANGQPMNLPNINVAVDKEASMKFNVPSDTRPGTYNIVMSAFAQFQYQKDEKDKKQNVQVYQVTPPVKLTVYDSVADITFAEPKPTVEAGKEVELVVKFVRKFDYKGEFDVQLQVSGGVGGISAQQVKVPAEGNEAKLVIKVAANVKELDRDDFKIRATARVSNATLTHEVPFGLKVTPAPEKKD